MDKNVRFAKWIFVIAGVYGIIALLPQYFLEEQLGLDFPPPLNHPEHFYGFIGVALAWQVVFLMIARDVKRYRPIMLAAILEKLSFGVAALVLWAKGRVAAPVAGFGVIDLLFVAAFIAAFWRTGEPQDSAEVVDEIVN